MELNEAQLVLIEQLVNELLKATPAEDRVQAYMAQAGLSDPKEPMARIQIVLDALRFEIPSTEFAE